MSCDLRFCWQSAALLSACMLVACSDSAPARLVFATDTLVINTLVPTRTGVVALSTTGDTVVSPRLTYALPATRAMRLNADRTITCVDDGDGVVSVAAGAAHATLPVRCHLIRAFGFPEPIELVLGSASVPLLVDARDKEGEVIQRARMPLIIDDTSVVQLKNGRLVGLKVGRVWISATDIKSSVPGERMGVASVSVQELIASSDTIAIAGGDSVVWPLKPGAYILVTSFDAGSAVRGVLTSWPGTYCPTVPPAAEHRLVCLVRPEARNARLVLRNTATDNSRPPLRGSLRLRRSA